jgi:hypothetical protein
MLIGIILYLDYKQREIMIVFRRNKKFFEILLFYLFIRLYVRYREVQAQQKV